MKKLLIALSIILMLSLVFVACSDNKNDGKTDETTVATEGGETDATTAPAESEGETEAEGPTSTTAGTTAGVTESSEGTSEETTEELTLSEEVLELTDKTENIMGLLEKIKHTNTSSIYLGDSLTSKSTTVTNYDGFYAHISNSEGDTVYAEKYFLLNVMHCLDWIPEDGEAFAILLSEEEADYFVAEHVKYNGLLSSATESFKQAELVYNDGVHTITFTVPTDKFIAEYSNAAVSVINASATVVINSGYTIASYTQSVELDIAGDKLTYVDSIEYSYDVEEVMPLTESFDGIKVVKFEDVFGYWDISYGTDLGLDVEGDNFVIDYENEERALKQMDFLGTYMDQYVGKSFTMYGIVEEFVEGLYCVNIHGRYITLIPEDGLSLSANSLVCVKGTLECVSESLEAYELNVDSVSVITEGEIPEGGYIPWTAYVTAKSLNVRSTADFGANNKVGVLTQNTKVKVIGFIPQKYCMIEYHWETEDGQSGEYAFCSLAYLSKLPVYYISLDGDFKPVNAPV